jgi:hypothetical protein
MGIERDGKEISPKSIRGDPRGEFFSLWDEYEKLKPDEEFSVAIPKPN